MSNVTGTNPATTQIQLTWTDVSNITRCIFVNRDGFEGNPRNKRFSMANCVLTFPYMRDYPVLPINNSMATFFPDREYPPLPLPWLDGAALCFGQFFLDGLPSPYCPRSFLSKQEKKLGEAGLKVTAGFELEFFLLKPDGTPVDSTLFGDTKSIQGKTWKVLSRIVSVLGSCDIPVWRYHAEAAPGQFELSIGPLVGSLVKAADSLVLARETIYHIAAEFDVKATFVPKPFQGELASGGHAHLSVQAGNGENLFEVDPAQGNKFLAGILQNLPYMLPILAPTGNSYERLQPSCWSGAFQCIGSENKEAAIRLIKDGDLIQRFELKTPDGTANPYLLLGSIVGAGLEGIKNSSAIPSEVNVDPASLPEAKQPPRLPSTLSEALQRFEASEFSRELYGEKLFQLILKVRSDENEFWETAPQEEKMKILLQRY